MRSRFVVGVAGAAGTTAGASFAIAQLEWAGRGWAAAILYLLTPAVATISWNSRKRLGPARELVAGASSCAVAGIVAGALAAADEPSLDEVWFDPQTTGLLWLFATGLVLTSALALMAAGRRVRGASLHT